MSATTRVLRALNDPDVPGYALDIAKAAHVPAGVLYPILQRLEDAQTVRSHWDDSRPPRRVYELWPASHRQIGSYFAWGRAVYKVGPHGDHLIEKCYSTAAACTDARARNLILGYAR